MRQQVRTRRRTRVLVTGVAGLLVAALVAGLLAVRQQQQREAADLAAVVAEVSRVDQASRNAHDVDQALLLALEANRLHDSAETRAVIADLLSGHHALIRSLVVPGAVQALALSPDGTTLMAGEGDSGTSTYRTDTLQTSHSLLSGWTNRLPHGWTANALRREGRESAPFKRQYATGGRDRFRGRLSLDFLQLTLHGDYVSTAATLPTAAMAVA